MSKKMHKDWGKIKQEPVLDDIETENKSDGFYDEDEGETGSGGVATATEGALSHASYRELEDKLTLAEQQAHENWEKSVRAQAEIDNIRRRTDREIQNAHRYGLEKFADALLPVIDSLEQALQLADKHQDQSMHEGIALTLKLFEDVFSKFNVIQINPEGEVFNPAQHEAMVMQDAPGIASNTVLNVFQKGYMLHDRVIRPARVIVAK